MGARAGALHEEEQAAEKGRRRRCGQDPHAPRHRPPAPGPPVREQACTTLQAQPGLLELLGFLKASGVKVGLITRNTTESVDAFFDLIGREWRGAFDLVLTRDNTPHVKPDPRSLLAFSEVRAAAGPGPAAALPSDLHVLGAARGCWLPVARRTRHLLHEAPGQHPGMA